MGTAIGIIIPIMPMFASQQIGINTSQYGLVIATMGWARVACNIQKFFKI